MEFASRDQDEWSRLARVRVLAAVNARLTLGAVVQSNSLARLALGNVRVRWNAGEGNDLWVVYGHHANLARDRVTPLAPQTAAASLVVKFTRSFGR